MGRPRCRASLEALASCHPQLLEGGVTSADGTEGRARTLGGQFTVLRTFFYQQNLLLWARDAVATDELRLPLLATVGCFAPLFEADVVRVDASRWPWQRASGKRCRWCAPTQCPRGPPGRESFKLRCVVSGSLSRDVNGTCCFLRVCHQAKVVAAITAEPSRPEYAGLAFNLTGPRSFTGDELAAVAVASTGNRRLR